MNSENTAAVNPPNFNTSANMSSSAMTKPPSQSQQEFKAKLDQKNWLQAFSAGIQDAVTLKVRTIVESAPTSQNSSTAEAIQLNGETGKRLYTEINLIDGNITNVFGEAFLNNPNYQSLVEFHKSEVSKGEHIIQTNIETVKKVVEYAIEFNKGLSK